MKVRPLISAILLAFFLLPGCQTQPENEAAMQVDLAQTSPEQDAASQPEEVPQNQPDEAIVTERKLIKDGTVSFETDDLTATRQKVTAAISRYGGYVSSDNAFKTEDRLSQTLVVRVPADRFDPLLADVTEGIDKLDRKEISVRDVTAEYLDIQARLKTKKALEARYLKLLDKANSVADVLAVEKQIGELRADIESIEGRLNFLKNQVALSTLTLTFYQTTARETRFGREFAEGLGNGWKNLLWFFVALVNLWPFVILIGLLYWGLKSWKRKAPTKE